MKFVLFDTTKGLWSAGFTQTYSNQIKTSYGKSKPYTKYNIKEQFSSFREEAFIYKSFDLVDLKVDWTRHKVYSLTTNIWYTQTEWERLYKVHNL
jgi:hypothetical protein